MYAAGERQSTSALLEEASFVIHVCLLLLNRASSFVLFEGQNGGSPLAFQFSRQPEHCST
jgi:hypothetical protein